MERRHPEDQEATCAARTDTATEIMRKFVVDHPNYREASRNTKILIYATIRDVLSMDDPGLFNRADQHDNAIEGILAVVRQSKMFNEHAPLLEKYKKEFFDLTRDTINPIPLDRAHELAVRFLRIHLMIREYAAQYAQDNQRPLGPRAAPLYDPDFHHGLMAMHVAVAGVYQWPPEGETLP